MTADLTRRPASGKTLLLKVPEENTYICLFTILVYAETQMLHRMESLPAISHSAI